MIMVFSQVWFLFSFVFIGRRNKLAIRNKENVMDINERTPQEQRNKDNLTYGMEHIKII